MTNRTNIWHIFVPNSAVCEDPDSGMPHVLSPGHWAVDRRGSRRLVGESLLLTRRGTVLHSGMDEGRSTLSWHGQWHLLFFVLGQSRLYSFCVDIWDRERMWITVWAIQRIIKHIHFTVSTRRCYEDRVVCVLAETMLSKFHSHYQTCAAQSAKCVTVNH